MYAYREPSALSTTPVSQKEDGKIVLEPGQGLIMQITVSQKEDGKVPAHIPLPTWTLKPSVSQKEDGKRIRSSPVGRQERAQVSQKRIESADDYFERAWQLTGYLKKRIERPA